MKLGPISLILGLVAASVPALAAPAPSALQVRQFLADYGTCIAKREPDLSRQAVLGEARFDRRSPDGKRLLQRECVDAEQLRNSSAGFAGKLRMDDETYRGVIAEALIVSGKIALPVEKMTSIPALTYQAPRPLRTEYPDGKPIPEENLERQRAAIARKTSAMAMGQLGECVVRAVPEKSRAVFEAAIETPAELQALNGLAGALQQCIPTGQTRALDRMSLRGALAISYYRLSQAAQPSGASQ